MPYAKMSDVPENLKKLDDAPLTLDQANAIAAHADGLKDKKGITAPYAIAVASFKRTHQKTEDGWTKKEKSLDREVLEAAGKDVKGYALIMRRTGDVSEHDMWDLHVVGLGTLVLEGLPSDKVPQVAVKQVRDVLFYNVEGETRYAADLVEMNAQEVRAKGDTVVQLVEHGQVTTEDGHFVFGGGSILDGEYSLQQEDGATWTFSKTSRETEPVPWIITLKKMLRLIARNAPMMVWKAKDDTRWYMALISKAIRDREGELVTHQAMDYSIALSKRHKLHSGLYVMHKVPQTRIGWAVQEKRIGPYWVELGRFGDGWLSDAVFKRLERDADGVCRLSIGFVAPREQARRGVYTRLLKYDTSVVDNPACPDTAITTIGGKDMSGLSDIMTLLDPQTDDERAMYEKALKEMLQSVTKDAVAVQKEDEDLTPAAQLEKLLSGLEAEQADKIKALFAASATKAAAPPPVEEDEDEEEED